MKRRRTRLTVLLLRGVFDRYTARATIEQAKCREGYRPFLVLEFQNRASALSPAAQERIARKALRALAEEFGVEVGPTEYESEGGARIRLGVDD